jgi:predicted transcriptional regulator
MRNVKARDGMTRAEYEGRAAERRAAAQRLRSQGLTVQAIAVRLGVSAERVRQLLSEAEPSVDDA